MTRVFNFGKIDYYRKGRRDNLVTVKVEYNEKNGKKVFSASGIIWNSRHTDAISGGQNLDEMHEYIHGPLFEEIYRLWKLYHLNDMHPECEHQRAAGWLEVATTSVHLYKFMLNTDVFTRQKDIERAALQSLKRGESVTLSNEERMILNLDISITSPSGTLPAPIEKFYKLKETQTNRLGWLREDQHPDGILSKPCPVCGYKYGSSWLYEPIPEEDEKIILSIIKTGELPTSEEGTK